jgi:hypothetical protein
MESRHVNPFLMLGMIVAPLLFVWFLLLPGYPRSTREAGFIAAFFMPVMWVLLLGISYGLGALPG